MPPIDDELEPNPLFTRLPDDDDEDDSEGDDDKSGEDAGKKPEDSKPEDKSEEKVVPPQIPTGDTVDQLLAVQDLIHDIESDIRTEYPDLEESQVKSITKKLIAAGGSQNLAAYKEAGAHLELGLTEYGRAVKAGKIKVGGAAPKVRKQEPSSSGTRTPGGSRGVSSAGQKFADIFGGALGDEETKKYQKLL
jgi:hypothetical protein